MRAHDIIAALKQEATLAASHGRDSLEWYTTPEGVWVGYPVSEGWFVEVFRDTSDPSNEGWAYRITPIRGGHLLMDRQESGPLFD